MFYIIGDLARHIQNMMSNIAIVKFPWRALLVMGLSLIGWKNRFLVVHDKNLKFNVLISDISVYD